jgi:hypothetical protein
MALTFSKCENEFTLLKSPLTIPKFCQIFPFTDRLAWLLRLRHHPEPGRCSSGGGCRTRGAGSVSISRWGSGGEAGSRCFGRPGGFGGWRGSPRLFSLWPLLAVAGPSGDACPRAHRSERESPGATARAARAGRIIPRSPHGRPGWPSGGPEFGEGCSRPSPSDHVLTD